ncbi:MAG: 50S ribosomal protein L11 methyltransferase [Thermovirga sp.]|nr:50S ribosomal protein L11 methyltransferase [Thermovirga sp.]
MGGEGFWWYITLEGQDGNEDDLSALADLSGSIGSEIKELPGRIAVKAYYRNTRDLGFWIGRVQEVINPWPGVKIVDMGRIENRQWHTAWKEAFPPLEVGRSIVVMAPWHKGKELQGRIPLYIYPGSAFGTGYHESTQVALELLEDTVKPGMKVIDVGTGSGILAVASLRMGAAGVIATDNDPAVIPEIRENLRLNGIPDGVVDIRTGDLLRGIVETADLVCANIVFDPLTVMMPEIPKVLPVGGKAVFSGLTVKERERFLEILTLGGLLPSSEAEKGDWWGVAASRTAGVVGPRG